MNAEKEHHKTMDAETWWHCCQPRNTKDGQQPPKEQPCPHPDPGLPALATAFLLFCAPVCGQLLWPPAAPAKQPSGREAPAS